MTIFLDFDGTVNNYFDRMWWVYHDVCSRFYISAVTRSEFFERKRNGQPLFPMKEPDIVWEYMNEKFEEPYYLSFDFPYYAILPILEQFQDVVIVSFRFNQKTLEEQLNNYGINCCKTIINTKVPSNYVYPKNLKADMIRKSFSEPSGIIVGDTEYEICAGKELGLKTIAVTWGVRGKEFLQKLNPDYIVDNPEQLSGILNEN